MQQRTTGSLDTPGAMPDPFKQPTEYLLAFLNRIAMLDKEGFFQRPVREEEAPNYYSIIKQPMCFADMREKINAGLYQTWRQLRDDFNLIHENARRFNSNKTLVHRAALNLQKNGNKVLANYELEVRKALAVLHPLGAQQLAGPAAGAQAPASSASATVTDRMDIFTSATVSGLVQAAEQNGEGIGLDVAFQRTSMSGPPSPEGGVDGASLPMTGSGPPTGAARQPFPAILLPPAPRDLLVGYISDEDDQPLLVVGTDAAAATAAAAASRSLAGLGPSHALPLDALLSQLRTTAVRVPYSCPKRQKGGGQGSGGGEASMDGAMQGGAGQSTSPIPSREWRQARRPVELRARWLELRMRELRSQQERLQNQINWLQQRKAAGGEGLVGNALAAGLGRPAVGLLVAAAGLAAASCAAEQEALVSAAGEFMSAGRVSNSLYFRVRPSTQGPVAAGSPLVADVSTPVTQMDPPVDPAQASCPNAAVRCESDRQPRASASGASDPGASGRSEELCRTMPPPKLPSQPGQAQPVSLRQPQRQQGPGRSVVQPLPLLPQQLRPCDEGESDKMLPGAIFASLELLEQRLSVVRARLQDTYKFDPNRLAVGRTQGPYASRAPSYQLASSGSLAAPGAPASGSQMLPSGPLAGHGAVKRQSSVQGRRPGSLTVLTRFDSMSLPSCKSTGTGGKRKRSEVELLTGDIGTPLAPYGRTSLDRSASVTAIVIPPVRELAPDEFRARIVAATTWSQHYHTIGPSALDAVPSEIQLVLRKRRQRGFCASGEEYDEDVGMGPCASRGVLSTSDDEGGAGGAVGVGGGPAAAMGTYSDSGVGDDEGSSSSSEDTSDEAYAARHRIMEEEEHRRYAAVVAEGQRRRNKGGSNASGGQQNQANAAGGGAAGSQAKERAKFGNKTPRYSSGFKLKEGLTLVSPELPMDGLDSAPPSATYGHYQPYQPYQPLMVGVTTMPPTPGSMASVLPQSQPVIVQQAVAQRTSSPPTVLQPSPSGAQGQPLQRPPGASLMTSTTTTAAPPPPAAAPVSVSPAVLPGKPPLPQAQSQLPVQQMLQPLLPSHKQPSSHQTSTAQTPQQVVTSAEGGTATGDSAPAELQVTQQSPSNVQPQELPPTAQLHAPSQAQQQQGQGQASQQQQAPLGMQSAEVQKQPQSPVAGGQPEAAPSVQGPQQHQQQESQLQAQADQQQLPLSEKPQLLPGPDAAEPHASAVGMKVFTESSATPTSKTEEAAATVAAGSAVEAPPAGSAAAQTAVADGSGAAEQTESESTAKRSEHLQPNPAAAQQQRAATKQDTALANTTSASTAAATAGSGGAANLAAATTAAATAATTAAETQTTAAGTSGTVSAAVAALTGQTQPLAITVGASSATGSALLGNPAAAAMIAQSPAMSMQFLTTMQGLGGGTGTGGSNNALTAAATSILLAAAAAASAGGQNAANNLMGNARTSALQQLAAGTPAAQVFANAAAAAAAAAAAGGSVGGGGAGTLGGLAPQGKQQPPLFSTAAAAAAVAASSRGIPLASALQSQAAGGLGTLGGLGGIGGLPAAFQSLQGFPQSLAGFNLNLAAGSGVGLGLQTGQRLADGLAGMGIMAQGTHHLQAHHHLQGMQLPAAAPPRHAQTQGQQQAGQAEGGRGAGRGRRASRTTVVEEEDEDWEEDDDEEEEAASPSARTRRSARTARRGSNGLRGLDNHGNGGPECATRQSRRRAAKGAHNWAVLLASESSEEEDGDEEWGARNGRRTQEGGVRGRGRGRRSAG